MIYLLLCGALYFFQEKILFHPFPIDAAEQLGADEIRISVDEGVDLSAIWLRKAGNKKALIYFHGNTGNLKRCRYQAQQTMTGHGYDVLVVDYRGFGKSDGALRSEDDLLLDAERVYETVRARYAEKDIAVLGYSMGSGPATHVAATFDPSQLILVAPYRSITRLMYDRHVYIPSFLLKYPLCNEHKLARVECPVTIAHGTADEVVPYDHGAYLGEFQNVDFHRFEGVRHRGIILSSALREVIGGVLK